MRKYYERDPENNTNLGNKKLYLYPDFEEGLGVFELEDLSVLSILVSSQESEVNVYIWKD